MRKLTTKGGIIIFVVFMALWIGGGIALFHDDLGNLFGDGSSGGLVHPTTAAGNTTTTTNDAALQVYKQAIASNAADLSQCMSDLSVLLQNYNPYSDDWILATAVDIALIRALYNDLLAITPPPSMITIHNKYVQGVSYFNTATYYLADGIDNMDADSIDVANTYMELGNSYINEATNLLLAYD